jgi:hypothetical protein
VTFAACAAVASASTPNAAAARHMSFAIMGFSGVLMGLVGWGKGGHGVSI